MYIIMPTPSETVVTFILIFPLEGRNIQKVSLKFNGKKYNLDQHQTNIWRTSILLSKDINKTMIYSYCVNFNFQESITRNENINAGILEQGLAITMLKPPDMFLQRDVDADALSMLYGFLLSDNTHDKTCFAQLQTWGEVVHEVVLGNRSPADVVNRQLWKMLKPYVQQTSSCSVGQCAILFMMVNRLALFEKIRSEIGREQQKEFLRKVMDCSWKEITLPFLHVFETLEYSMYLDKQSTYFHQVLLFFPLVPLSKWRMPEDFSNQVIAEAVIHEAFRKVCTSNHVFPSDDHKCVIILQLIEALPVSTVDQHFIRTIEGIKQCLDSSCRSKKILTRFTETINVWLKKFVAEIPSTAVVSLYNSLQKHDLITQNINKTFLLAVNHKVTKKLDQKELSATVVLLNMLKQLNYADPNLSLTLVANLLRTNSEQIIKSAVDILRNIPFDRIQHKDDTMLNIADLWLTALEDRFLLGQYVDKTAQLFPLCTSFAEISQVLSGKKVQNMLMEKGVEMLRGKIQLLVESFSHMCEESAEVQKWYLDILKAILADDNLEHLDKILEWVPQADNSEDSGSSFAADWYRLFLDVITLPDKTQTNELLITTILKNIRFWQKIFVCGKNNTVIRYHSVVTTVKNELHDMYMLVQNMEIDFATSLKINEIIQGDLKMNLVSLVSLVLEEFRLPDRADVGAYFDKLCINAECVESKLTMMKNVLDIIPVIKGTIDILDLPDAQKHLNDLKNTVEEVGYFSIGEILKGVDELARKYLDDTSIYDYEILDQLQKSVLFQRICQRCLQKSTTPGYTIDVIRLVLTTAWDNYESVRSGAFCSEVLLEDAIFWLEGVELEKEAAENDWDLSFLEFLANIRSRNCLSYLKYLITELKVRPSVVDDLTACINGLVSNLDEKNTCHVGELKENYKNLTNMIGVVNRKEWDVIYNLGEARQTFMFIKEKINDDVRFLIEAVVDTDQQVNSKIVRYFNRLHEFVRSMVNEKYGKNLQKVLEKLRQENSKSGYELALMFEVCKLHLHDLKQLYLSVIDKDVIIANVVRQTLQRSTFSFKLEGKGQCSFTVSYQKPGGKDIITRQSQMVEYRSRAFLLQSSSGGTHDMGDSKLNISPEDYKRFVKCITFAMEICKLCDKLYESGCFSYRTFVWTRIFEGNKVSCLEDKKQALERDLAKWSQILEKTRQEYYYLTYVYADQLWTLYDYFSTGMTRTNSQLGDIFRFISPKSHIDAETLWKNEYSVKYEKEQWEEILKGIGKNLCSIFSNYTKTTARPMPKDKSPEIAQATPAVVNRGDFLIVPLEKDSCYVVPTILKLYQQTTGLYPQPFQILMSTQDTSSEEVELFLRRCFDDCSTINQDKYLYCIANIELLSHQVLFTLVERLQQIAVEEEKGDLHHRLAVICRGDPQQALLVQFASKCRSVGVVPPLMMESLLHELDLNVKVVVSDVAGLGKTNYIHKIAFDKGKQIRTVFISSKFEKSKFIEDIRGVCLTEGNILHLDISSISNPSFLDDELFEFLVTGMLSSGTALSHLPTKHVMIEIANTQIETKGTVDLLQNVLPFTFFFPKESLHWENFANFTVSNSLWSPVQTVCHYFKSYDDEKLDCSDIVPTRAINAPKCRTFLQRYVWEALEGKGMSEKDMSFSIACTFLSMLAVQLKRMSSSVYFQVSVLKMTGNGKSDLKSKLFNALVDVVADFSVRSVKSSGDFQKSTQTCVSGERSPSEAHSYDKSVDKRFKGMVHWSDSNHLMVLFHDQDPDTISPIYHDLKDVPDGIKILFENLNAKLPDFTSQSPEDLMQLLCRIVIESSASLSEEICSKMLESYALTADNFQKMVLIKWKINAGIPVIIMGDTGCGKTSLIQFLADLCTVNFSIFGFHAGITEIDIIDKIGELNKNASEQLNKQFWVLLDEINTCDYLGLLNEILCSHTMKGTPLAPNVVFMAACNPYCLRKRMNIFTSGLEDKRVVDARSPLVYRVHPLPEGMIDYVWDFGFLSDLDEEKYIEKMMINTLTYLDTTVKTQVLCYAQKFIREKEDCKWCVSLRDVRRCQYLMRWFDDMYIEKEKTSVTKSDRTQLQLQSLLLAVSFCYMSRLSDRPERKSFEKELLERVKMVKNARFLNEVWFTDLIQREQLKILNTMDLPSGIAKNEALRENVFVMFVCIMAKLPLFVVGKPGSSKSLSMQIIRTSLRGSQSKDNFLKSLPSLYVLSCQGSESLVSADISRVFEKAAEYNEQNKKTEDKLLPVVLLDEVGLAECSPHNPLKVLHTLLEPGKNEFPEVAVIGISNWALDASKMNRAIHLSRPDLDREGLLETGLTIAEDIDEENPLPDEFRKVIISVTDAYYEYSVKQKDKGTSKRHFHGLRDFYSLIKYLCYPLNGREDRSKLLDPQRIIKGILRNFGGFTSASDKDEMLRHFKKNLKEHLTGIEGSVQSLELIEESLTDSQSRHLLLLSHGDSALSIIQNQLTSLKFNHKVIFGSKFKEDTNSEDYNCKKLSEIILCMEQGTVLVLKDLDGVYGSLYDMLNQNYGIIGEKQICRVARGTFSNPICEVHKKFKCIVLIDENRVGSVDPPFLNRFEKQVLNILDLLDDEENTQKQSLRQWVSDNTKIDGFEGNTNTFILNHHKELIPSLILRDRSRNDPKGNLEQKQHDELLLLALPDAIVRLSRRHERGNFESIQNIYFDLPINKGLNELIKSVEKHAFSPEVGASLLTSSSWGNAIGFRLVVFTHSNIYINISECLDQPSACEVQKLAAIKAEKQLENILKCFLDDDTKTMFFLQCQISSDASNIILARSLIENLTQGEKKKGVKKNFCIIVHIDRRTGSCQDEKQFSLFNYMSRWQLVTLESLEKQSCSLPDLSKMRIVDVVKSPFYCLDSVIKEHILHAFLLVHYTGMGRSPVALNALIQKIIKCDEVMQVLKHSVMNLLEKGPEYTRKSPMSDSKNWVVDIACSSFLLSDSQTIFDAIKSMITTEVKQVFNAIIFTIESLHAWPCLSAEESHSLNDWVQLFNNKDIFAVDEKLISVSGKPLNLQFPFSFVFLSKLEKSMHDLVTTDIKELKLIDENLAEDDGELKDDVWKKLVSKYRDTFDGRLSAIRYTGSFEIKLKDFINDICLIHTGNLSVNIPTDCRLKIIKYLVQTEKISGFNHEKTDELTWSNFASVCLEFLFRLWNNSILVFDTLHVLDACILVGQEDLINDLIEKFRIDAASREHLSSSSDSLVSDVSFTDYLVNDVCTNFMPTKDLLDRCGDICSWQNQAGKIMSVASRVGWSVPALHMLRVCNDFASMLIQLPNQPNEPLIALANGALAEKQRGLERKSLYKAIKESSHILQVPTNIHRFLCLYFGRCLDARVETVMLEDILEYTLDEKFQVEYFGPVLYRCIKPFEPSLCQLKDIISKPDYFDTEPTLKAIDQHLSCVHLTEDNNPGLKFAVLCCDIVEYAVMQSDDMQVNVDDLMWLSSNRDDLDALLLKISQVIYEAERCSLKFICCVAYARAYLRVIGQMLCGDPLKITHDDTRKLIYSTAKVFPAGDCKRVDNRVTYSISFLLRSLYDLSDYDHLQKICCNHLQVDIAAIEAIIWPDNPGWKVIGFNPFPELPTEDEATAALEQLLIHEHDTTLMKKFLTEINSERKESLLSTLMVRMYLKRINNPPTEDEKDGAKQLQELMRAHSLPLSYQHMANFFSGLVSLKLLEETSTIKQLRVRILILHVLSTAVSSEGFLNSLTFPLNKHAIKGSFIQMFDSLCSAPVANDDNFHGECYKCGCFTVSNTTWKCCPRCHSESDFTKTKKPKADQLVNVGISNEFTTGHFSPRAFRATRVIINCCLLGAVLTETSTQMPEGIDQNEDVLLAKIELDVEVLMDILDVRERTVFSFLHKAVCAIRRVSPEVLNNNEAFGNFEQRITSTLESLNYGDFELSCRPLNVLGQVMEFETETSVGSFRHFLRFTPTREFSKVVAESLTWKNLENNQYKLLRFIVHNRKYIDMLRFLHPLVNWTTSIEKEMGHRITRAEASKKSVDEVVGTEELPLVKTLERFRETWKRLVKMKPLIEELNTQLSHAMENVDLTQRFDQYIMDSEKSPIYMMIQYLVRIQNYLVNEVMEMAIVPDGANSIQFLFHSQGTMIAPLVPVEDLSEKDIIGTREGAFENVLFLMEFDPAYGHGMQSWCDLDKVQFNLVQHLFFRKCFIQWDGRLPLFLYEEELFFSYDTLLSDIHDIIHQSEIDESIKNGLKTDLEKSPFSVRDMLMNLEIVLTLLKKTGGNPKQSLLSYVETWMTTNAFPTCLLAQTRQTILLCHVSELYEYYELSRAKAIISNLPGDKFHVKTGEEVKTKVNDCIQNFNQENDLNPKHFVEAVKRYVVRYIRAMISKLKPPQLEMPIQDELRSKRTLWPREPEDGSQWKKMCDLIPRELLVRHAKEIIQEADKLLEESEPNPRETASWMPNAEHASRAKKKHVKVVM